MRAWPTSATPLFAPVFTRHHFITSAHHRNQQPWSGADLYPSILAPSCSIGARPIAPSKRSFNHPRPLRPMFVLLRHHHVLAILVAQAPSRAPRPAPYERCVYVFRSTFTLESTCTSCKYNKFLIFHFSRASLHFESSSEQAA